MTKLNKFLTVSLLSGLLASEVYAYNTEIKDIFHVRTGYDTNEGTQDFTSPWVEFGDDGSSVSSGVSTTYEKIYVGDGSAGIWFDKNSNSTEIHPTTNVYRGFNAENATAMTVTLSGVDTSSLMYYDPFVGPGAYTNYLYVQLWTGNGWTTIFEISDKNGVQPVGVGIPSTARRADGGIRLIPNDWTQNNKSEVAIGTITIGLTYDDVDTDGDNVIDHFDVDDDNDGIYDTVETTVNTSNVAKFFNLVGDAVVDPGDPTALIMTSDDPFRKGAINSRLKLNLSHDFTYEVEINVGSNNANGGDGMVFVMHNDPAGINAIGAAGGGMGAFGDANTGVAGIQNGIGVEIDTHQNLDADDPNDSHTAMRRTDADYQSLLLGDKLSEPSAVYRTPQTGAGNIKDGGWHNLKVSWIAASQTLSYSLENVTGSRRFVDIVNNYFGGSTLVHVSFTASTGSETNEHKMRNIRLHTFFDSDKDGIEDKFDLDSDNDGISDNIEAQTTVATVPSSVPVIVDASGRNTAYPAGGLQPGDLDNDGKVDYKDTDSDGDRISDCIEGLKESEATGTRACPVDPTSLTLADNGRISWAETTPAVHPYEDVSGNIDGSGPVLGGSLIDYETGTTEKSYREYSNCGNLAWELKANQWKTITAPCVLASDLDTIFTTAMSGGPNGGTYGENGDWVMYRQNNLTGSHYHGYTMMQPQEQMTATAGYWIISNHDVNVRVLDSAHGSTENSKVPVSNHSENVFTFNEVHRTITVPAGPQVNKYLLGNAFSGPLNVSDIFVTGDAGTNYYPLSDAAHVDPFLYRTVYVYDALGISGANYVAKTSGTPGFTHTIENGIGIWLGAKGGTGAAVGIDFPYYNTLP